MRVSPTARWRFYYEDYTPQLADTFHVSMRKNTALRSTPFPCTSSGVFVSRRARSHHPPPFLSNSEESFVPLPFLALPPRSHCLSLTFSLPSLDLSTAFPCTPTA